MSDEPEIGSEEWEALQDALDARAAEVVARHQEEARRLKESLFGVKQPSKPFHDTRMNEFDDFLRGPHKQNDEGPGNGPVPARKVPPSPVLAGGAARTFEEAEEPPRNP